MAHVILPAVAAGSTHPTPRSSPRLPSRREVLAGAAALGLAAVVPSCARRRPPNVLFVLSDAHRASALGCYGEDQVRTPHFDAFAAQGVQLDTCISNTPVCRPYRASLMTGAYSHHTGLLSNLLSVRTSKRRTTSRRNFGVDALGQWRPGGLATLGETFAAAGYRCGYVGKWHLGDTNLDPGPLRFGFDDAWAVGRSAKHDYFDWAYYTGKDQLVARKGPFLPTVETDLAIDFLRTRAGDPWFLTLSWGPPHAPFTPPDGFRRDAVLQAPESVPAHDRDRVGSKTLPLYYGLVEALDHEFGRLVGALEDLSLAADTIVVYTSDHGIMLGSHGLTGKETPYSASTRVPFLVRWPGVLPAGVRGDMPFGTPDIFPTLCGLAGIAVPASVDGEDLAPVLRGDVDGVSRATYLTAHEPEDVPWPGWRGVRTERHLYARTEDGPWLLFDVAADRHELRNLVEEDSSLVAELDDRTRELMSRLGDSWRGA